MGHADSSAYPDQPQPGQPGPAQPGSAQPGPAQPASGEAAPPTPGPRYFPDLPPAIDLPAMEHDVLARWQDGKFFQRSLEATAGRPLWTFYEGPPTTNGMPGVHHIEARVFKDVFPRFKTMQGFHVPRQGGWDCHGLPVEVAVERELGLSGKKAIESYGIAEFNARCRESAQRHVDAFEEMTVRLGYWVDLQHAYRTMDTSYIESVWWSLKEIFTKGLLVKDFRISPYCPRCETPLSDHEMGQPDVYRLVTDPAVTVRFPLVSLPDGANPLLDGADLLVWTTTPWTLVSNTAVAVHPDESYAIARKPGDGDTVVVAENLVPRVLGEGWHVVATVPGAHLVGATYRPPFNLVEIAGAHRVVPGGFVTTEDGTGLVHLAPAFGADDMETSRAHGLPVVNPVRPDGRFEEWIPLVGGMFFKEANEPLVRDLTERGLLFRVEQYEHSYPHCWRCHTPLLYYALPSWYIRTTQVKDLMLAENERTNWQPPTIKHGRYGEWLRNNVDWALSRTRYWGTPLPIWECGEQHLTCAGSLAELSELAAQDLSGLDPHRPYVDEVTLTCPECGGEARRVPEVIDAWYDSGSMPFARLGAPWQNAEEFRRTYPAQFICEAIDQTRGWFYSLMAVGCLVFGRNAYENVVCLGLVVDERGRKMSKHLGNVLEPLPLMEAHGADAIRWFFAASGSPWSTRRIGDAALDEIVRKVLLTYWNTVSFLVLYANAAAAQGQAWRPPQAAQAPPASGRPLLDRWLLSELHATTDEVTASLEGFDTAAAGRRLAAFIDDLSNWYVRRSRRRFWEGAAAPDGSSAFATLYESLHVLTRLMAPLTPFLADHVWAVLRGTDDPESVHLASWPAADQALIDPRLSAQMAQTRRLVELGRSARASASVPVRQPLPRAVVSAAGFAELAPGLRAEVARELNVRTLEPMAAVGEDLVDYVVKPNFRTLGRRFGKGTKAVAAAITAAEPAVLAAELRSTGKVSVEVDGSTVALGPDDVIVTQTPRTGWTVASEGGETVGIEVLITPELRREGLAREVIRLIQDARKSDGLHVSDRITVAWEATDPDLSAALAEHGQLIAGEVLADQFGPATPTDTDPAGGAHQHAEPDLGLTFWLTRA
ncbi:MAG: isoleucine--tRNA ligase [Streptosporangiaceae bacterium]|jgi:isoleucyl-tRNA synthetase